MVNSVRQAASLQIHASSGDGLQIIERIGSQPALYSPETNFQYSNLGLTLAGEVVAATSGMPYDRYVRSNILQPLGLSSTTPEMPESERGRRLATGYTALDREGKREPRPFFTARGIGTFCPAMPM